MPRQLVDMDRHDPSSRLASTVAQQPGLAHAQRGLARRVCSSSASSSATSLSSSSVLVATPDAKRSPITRRASVAAATASAGRFERGARRLEVQQPLPRLNCDRVVELLHARAQGAAWATAAARSARAAPAVPERPRHVHAEVPAGVPAIDARHEALVRPRRLDGGHGGHLWPRGGRWRVGQRRERRLPRQRAPARSGRAPAAWRARSPADAATSVAASGVGRSTGVAGQIGSPGWRADQPGELGFGQAASFFA